MQRAAMLELAPEVVANLLQLPPGAHIDSVRSPADRPGVLEVRIRGAGWLCAPGTLIPRAAPAIYSKPAADGFTSYRVDWNFPAP